MTNWYVIRCTSGQERAAAARLERLGYPGGWWPQKQSNAISGSKKRAMRQAKKRGAVVPPQKELRPYIPGYVFVPTHDLEIHRVRSHPEARLWMAALVINGRAVSLSDADMCQMRDIPDRLKEMLADMEAQLKAEREARRPVAGAEAVIMGGVFEGRSGIVEQVTDAGACIDVGGMLGFVTVPLDMAERVA